MPQEVENAISAMVDQAVEAKTKHFKAFLNTLGDDVAEKSRSVTTQIDVLVEKTVDFRRSIDTDLEALRVRVMNRAN